MESVHDISQCENIDEKLAKYVNFYAMLAPVIGQQRAVLTGVRYMVYRIIDLWRRVSAALSRRNAPPIDLTSNPELSMWENRASGSKLPGAIVTPILVWLLTTGTAAFVGFAYAYYGQCRAEQVADERRFNQITMEVARRYAMINHAVHPEVNRASDPFLVRVDTALKVSAMPQAYSFKEFNGRQAIDLVSEAMTILKRQSIPKSQSVAEIEFAFEQLKWGEGHIMELNFPHRREQNFLELVQHTRGNVERVNRAPVHAATIDFRRRSCAMQALLPF